MPWFATFNLLSKPLRARPGDALTNAIHENALQMAEKIRKSVELGDLAPKIRVVSGYYSLDTGKVEWDKK